MNSLCSSNCDALPGPLPGTAYLTLAFRLQHCSLEYHNTLYFKSPFFPYAASCWFSKLPIKHVVGLLTRGFDISSLPITPRGCKKNNEIDQHMKIVAVYCRYAVQSFSHM